MTSNNDILALKKHLGNGYQGNDLEWTKIRASCQKYTKWNSGARTKADGGWGSFCSFDAGFFPGEFFWE